MSGGRRKIGTRTALGAVLVFGMIPLVGAPPADADFGIEDLFDPVNWFDASAIGDVGGLAGAAAVDPTELFQQDLYLPLHQALQDWIESPTGNSIDSVLNAPFALLTGRGLIENGVAGTEADPDGGAGGWLLGDGGAGWNSTVAGVAGGNGGDSGLLFGDGGDGGTGGFGIGSGSNLTDALTALKNTLVDDSGTGTDLNFGFSNLSMLEGGAGGVGGTGGAADGGIGGAGGDGGDGGVFSTADPGGASGFGNGGNGGDGGAGDGGTGGAGGLGGNGGQGGPNGNGAGGVGGNGANGSPGQTGEPGGNGGADGTPGTPGRNAG